MRLTLIFFLLSLKQINFCSIQIKNFSLYINLIETLYKEGFILYYFLNKKIVKIFLFTQKNLFQNYKIISTTSSNSFFFNYKTLYRHQEKGLTFFISTTKGIQTLLTCKKKKLGGHLLFKL